MPSRALLGKNSQMLTTCGNRSATDLAQHAQDMLRMLYEAVRFARPRPYARTAPSANAISTRSTPRSTRSTTSSPSSASAPNAPCRGVRAALPPVAPCGFAQWQRASSVPRARPVNGDPNVVGTPEIVGTPLCVVVHGGGLSEVDG